MRVHVFRCKLLGWGSNYEGVWFDASQYSKEEARAQFAEHTGFTTKANGESYPYTYYEYDGVKYYSIQYVGEYERDDMPGNYKHY